MRRRHRRVVRLLRGPRLGHWTRRPTETPSPGDEAVLAGPPTMFGPAKRERDKARERERASGQRRASMKVHTDGAGRCRTVPVVTRCSNVASSTCVCVRPPSTSQTRASRYKRSFAVGRRIATSTQARVFGSTRNTVHRRQVRGNQPYKHGVN